MSSAVQAFVFSGSDWRKSDGDDWNWDVVDLEGNEKVVGHYKIDGVIYKIVQNTEGKLFALSK